MDSQATKNKAKPPPPETEALPKPTPPEVEQTAAPAKSETTASLTPQEIRFANGHRAQVVTPPPDTPAAKILSALGLEGHSTTLLIVGGDELLDEEMKARLTQLFSRGVARAAADVNTLLIDGGRATGAMAIMGRGVADRGRQTPLLGVAPAQAVTYPGGPAADGRQPLDPNHSHFVLVPPDQPGAETDFMLDLAAALPQGEKVVVTILVGGDAVAKKQVLESVRRDWPVVVIKNSGGLADEIADLAQRRPPFIPDPDLSEIIVEGKLHFFQLEGSISGFERLLEQLLQYQEEEEDSILELAWEGFAMYDANANRQQYSFGNIQLWILALGVVATFLALIQHQLRVGNIAPAMIPILHYIILVIPITSAILIAAANRFSAGTKWILLRATAESIKKEIFRYRARAEIYSDQETRTISREVKLSRKIEALSRKLMQTEVNISALKPYNGPIPPKYGAASGDDGFSFLSPHRYLTYRLEDQLSYYRSKTVKLERQLRRLQWLVYIAGGVGTLLVALDFELWIALTTTLVTAFTTYLEYQQVEITLMRYNQTATDLANVRSWWIALSAEEQADPYNIDKLVGQIETTIHSEHAAWVQEMQDAMAELRAEQSEELSTQKESGTGLTSVEPQTLSRQ